MATYAVGDLHGQYDTFAAGLEKIGFQDSDQLYVIGDAIDRGDDGIKILQYIKKHKNMDLILGNHEFMMLNSVDPEGKKKCNGRDSDLWLYYNEGRKTFEKYGLLSVKSRLSLLSWLKERYVIKTITVEDKAFCLTHSYFKQGLENKKYSEMSYGDVWNIVWTSMYREDWETHGYNVYGDYDYTFITGHVPVLKVMRWFQYKDDFNELRIFTKGNFIDIDGGCALGYREGLNNGALFLRLEDLKVYTVPLVGEK